MSSKYGFKVPDVLELAPLTTEMYRVFRTAEFYTNIEGKMVVTNTEEHLKDEVVRVLLDFEWILNSFVKLYGNAREN